MNPCATMQKQINRLAALAVAALLINVTQVNATDIYVDSFEQTCYGCATQVTITINEPTFVAAELFSPTQSTRSISQPLLVPVGSTSIIGASTDDNTTIPLLALYSRASASTTTESVSLDYATTAVALVLATPFFLNHDASAVGESISLLEVLPEIIVLATWLRANNSLESIETQDFADRYLAAVVASTIRLSSHNKTEGLADQRTGITIPYSTVRDEYAPSTGISLGGSTASPTLQISAVRPGFAAARSNHDRYVLIAHAKQNQPVGLPGNSSMDNPLFTDYGLNVESAFSENALPFLQGGLQYDSTVPYSIHLLEGEVFPVSLRLLADWVMGRIAFQRDIQIQMPPTSTSPWSQVRVLTSAKNSDQADTQFISANAAVFGQLYASYPNIRNINIAKAVVEVLSSFVSAISMDDSTQECATQALAGLFASGLNNALGATNASSALLVIAQIAYERAAAVAECVASNALTSRIGVKKAIRILKRVVPLIGPIFTFSDAAIAGAPVASRIYAMYSLPRIESAFVARIPGQMNDLTAVLQFERIVNGVYSSMITMRTSTDMISDPGFSYINLAMSCSTPSYCTPPNNSPVEWYGIYFGSAPRTTGVQTYASPISFANEAVATACWSMSVWSENRTVPLAVPIQFRELCTPRFDIARLTGGVVDGLQMRQISYRLAVPRNFRCSAGIAYPAQADVEFDTSGEIRVIAAGAPNSAAAGASFLLDPNMGNPVRTCSQGDIHRFQIASTSSENGVRQVAGSFTTGRSEGFDLAGLCWRIEDISSHEFQCKAVEPDVVFAALPPSYDRTHFSLEFY